MATGFTYSIANAEQILGIIILIIQCIWFGLKLYIKVKEMLKDGITEEEVDKLKEDVVDMAKEVITDDDDT